MLKKLWTLLFGKTEEFPDGQYLVIQILGHDSYAVVYETENYKEAVKELKLRVRKDTDTFVVTRAVGFSSFEVKVKAKKK